MAAEPHQELIIIKRHGGHGDGHHGGAWKIAFADFMTAMMALFLVLWLISATNPKQKIVIAHYFNPVKLAEVSVNKKGLEDPNPGEGGHGGPKAGNTEKKLELPPLQEKKALFDRGDRQPSHDEASLFRDPYAILSEIAAQPQKQEDKSKIQLKGEVVGSNSDEALPENNDTFRDPFSTTPSVEARVSEQQAVNAGAPSPASSVSVDELTKDPVEIQEPKPATAKTAALPAPAPLAPPPAAPLPEKEKTPSVKKDAIKTPSQPPHPTAAEQQEAADARASEAEATKLRTEIAAAVRKDTTSAVAPNIEVKSTPEGVLITLTDDHNYAMFAVGSAEPQKKTIEAMEKVARLLKDYPGLIVVRGHTDGRPYRSATYDNWQLSAARAQMAHYMLVRGGLDEKRIDRIEGYADHQLKLSNDPFGAENRRIEILLRKDKS
jgi:chemotaxis protein MotB